jgi:hypothetical protein
MRSLQAIHREELIAALWLVVSVELILRQTDSRPAMVAQDWW